jgi:hypothetical protein
MDLVRYGPDEGAQEVSDNAPGGFLVQLEAGEF